MWKTKMNWNWTSCFTIGEKFHFYLLNYLSCFAVQFLSPQVSFGQLKFQTSSFPWIYKKKVENCQSPITLKRKPFNTRERHTSAPLHFYFSKWIRDFSSCLKTTPDCLQSDVNYCNFDNGQVLLQLGSSASRKSMCFCDYKSEEISNEQAEMESIYLYIYKWKKWSTSHIKEAAIFKSKDTVLEYLDCFKSLNHLDLPSISLHPSNKYSAENEHT